MNDCKIENSSWNPPPIGSEERDKMPRKAFMIPGDRLYPFMSEDADGNWVVDPEGLRAVISVANRNGDTSISRRASEMLKKYHEQNSSDKGGDLDDMMGLNSLTALRYRASQILHEQAAGESAAMQAYSQAMNDLVHMALQIENEDVKALLSNAVEQIKGNISDEKNHLLILQSVINSIDCIKIAGDGMTVALENIVSFVDTDES